MPLSIVDIQAFVHNFIVPTITDVIFKRSPVFTRLSTKNAERFTGGRQIYRPIIHGKLIGGAFAQGDTFNITYRNTETALVLDLKAYYVNITLYGLDAIKDRGPHAVFTQVETKFQNAAHTMAELLATDMYMHDTGARAKNLTGFDRWYDDGNTYANVGGIDRVDIHPLGQVGGLNAFTQNVGTSFTMRDLNRAYGFATWGSDHPDLIAVTQNAYNLIWEANAPFKRYVNSEGDLVEAGFQSFRFNAADVAVCQYLSDAFAAGTPTIFGINTDYVEWYFSDHPLYRFGFTGFKPSPNTLDVSGQFVVASNIVVPNPRTGFKLRSTLF